jgi:GT2 family glycosyltransferase
VNPRLTIAIPTYRNRECLQYCLSTMFNYTDVGEFAEVIIVDNGVHENGGEFDYWNYPLKVVTPAVNLGWMKSINLALVQAESEFFVMLNDDVGFIPNSQAFWHDLLEWFELDRVEAVIPSTNLAYGAQSIFAPVPLYFETSYATGVCMAVRRNEMLEMDGLDDDKLYGDDYDFSRRILERGKRIICDRSLFIYHAGGQTTERVGASRPLREGETKEHEGVYETNIIELGVEEVVKVKGMMV